MDGPLAVLTRHAEHVKNCKLIVRFISTECEYVLVVICVRLIVRPITIFSILIIFDSDKQLFTEQSDSIHALLAFVSFLIWEIFCIM